MLLPQRHFLTHPISRPHRSLRQLRGIVVHWTGNVGKGAHAMANRNYFNMGSRAASAHYIVDDHSIIQCLPDNEVGYHCGDRPLGKYKPDGLALMKGYGGTTPNYFTIGIEMCVNSDGDWDKTYQHTVELVAWLFLAHNLPDGALFRHYDITGKPCPRPLMDPGDWTGFIKDVQAAILTLLSEKCGTGIVNALELNIRQAPGDLTVKLGTLSEGDAVLWTEQQGDWVRIADTGWINVRYVTVNPPKSLPIA